MFILANFLSAVAHVVDVLLTILYWLVLIRAFISWVNPDPYNPIVQFLHNSTEPILAPIRNKLPISLRLGIDISPIIAFLIIIFLKQFVVSTLISIAIRLG